VSRIVSASREIAAAPDVIFELIADPAQQPRWDGNGNLTEAAAGQRVRAVGDVFRVMVHSGTVRENHIVEFEEGRRIAWLPSEEGKTPPGHLWRWEIEPLGDDPAGRSGATGELVRSRVTHTYDWTNLTEEKRLVRAKATTADNLAASIERLAALSERA
jgi:uncharacterized protein YndB with AHSA1/START domain